MTRRCIFSSPPTDPDHSNPLQKLNDLLENLMGSDEPLVQTGALAQSRDQFVQLWGLREGIPEAVSKEGKAYKYDISIPLSTFKEVVDVVRKRLIEKGLYKAPGGVKECIGYGHIGDGESLPLRSYALADVYGRKPASERHR
jgi:FAD/FMN-containing dehydrogenase